MWNTIKTRSTHSKVSCTRTRTRLEGVLFLSRRNRANYMRISSTRMNLFRYWGFRKRSSFWRRSSLKARSKKLRRNRFRRIRLLTNWRKTSRLLNLTIISFKLVFCVLLSHAWTSGEKLNFEQNQGWCWGYDISAKSREGPVEGKERGRGENKGVKTCEKRILAEERHQVQHVVLNPQQQRNYIIFIGARLPFVPEIKRIRRRGRLFYWYSQATLD